MKTPIRAMIPMLLLALALSAFGWWQLGDVPLTEEGGHEHVEYDD
ncbi:hypothetical protein [Guyparkeria hydrothermalis]|nr:hypothetical protein [Guyparkeria hydrothermalis]